MEEFGPGTKVMNVRRRKPVSVVVETDAVKSPKARTGVGQKYRKRDPILVIFSGQYEDMGLRSKTNDNSFSDPFSLFGDWCSCADRCRVAPRMAPLFFQPEYCASIYCAHLSVSRSYVLEQVYDIEGEQTLLTSSSA